MADLSPGTVLQDRFELLGVVGRGGTATVYLAMDRLRKHRVALKVVHPHLANDPGVQRRMQSEVQAASVVRHEGALVPYDLHQLDAGLALAMPFHPGHTLAEATASAGPLSADGVRALGIRLAQVLAEAHRAGVLHRDITANNVLLGDDPAQAVLTDFGLARVTRLHTSRTTGLLGTAGYAAPEVYAGDRADPRSDLYGLGAVLYLAATGRPAFDPGHPMGGLQQQLDEAWTPIAELRPDLPQDLAQTIERLLRREPDDRPQGAREVVDALERRVAPEAPQRTTTAPTVRRQYLQPGSWTVVVKETDEDKGRRQQLRIDRGKARSTTESEIARWGKQIAETVRDALGMPVGPATSPEAVLAGAVADEAGLDPSAVTVPRTMLISRFRLVEATDEKTARRLVAAAKDAGFKAKAVELLGPPTVLQHVLAYFWVPIVLAWVSFPFLLEFFPLAVLLVFNIGLSILLPSLASGARATQTDVEELPVVYDGALHGALTEGEHPKPRYAVAVEPTLPTDAPAVPEPAPTPAAPLTRGEALRDRALAALDGLERAVQTQADALPEVALRDLRGTVSDLRTRAVELGVDVDRLADALDDNGTSDTDHSWMRDRRDRLRTLERAGEAVDPREVERLEAALAQHEADNAAAIRVEAQLTASSAQLLEIASTASRVRRELLSEREPARSADALVERLRNEAQAADAARNEADEARRDARRRKEAAARTKR